MFTVKLMKVTRWKETPEGSEEITVIRESTKIVEGAQVDIYYGQPSPVEIAVTDNAGHVQAFYVRDRRAPLPDNRQFPENTEFFYAAYIENANGKTTQSVTF